MNEQEHPNQEDMQKPDTTSQPGTTNQPDATSQPYTTPPQPYGYNQPQQPPYPPYPPYPSQPPYPTPVQQPYSAQAQPKPKKVWPWILAACIVGALLGIGGCVSCAIQVHDGLQEVYSNSGSEPQNNYSYDYNYGYDNNSSSSPDSTSNGYTREEIENALGDLPNKIEDGRCGPGVYEIGLGKDIDPGLYFVEGNANAEGSFILFDYDEDTATYVIDSSVVYFGNYFTELEEDDLIAYTPADDTSLLYPVDQAKFSPSAPYGPGLYRVGTDIPAGTYTITTVKEATANASSEAAGYVMKDLDFDEDSITDTKYVVAGGSQTLTVKDGDYLELYATTATATE